MASGSAISGAPTEPASTASASRARAFPMGEPQARRDHAGGQSGAASTSIELWPVDSFGAARGKEHGDARALRASGAHCIDRLDGADRGRNRHRKNIVAHALHEASPRVAKPMVVVDCAALPENLLEAELFGHAKGAFTGAGPARAGAIESADGSTVFLDEVGELPLSMQPKLLRAIESRTVRRLGETAYRTVDVRFVSATHRDLRRMVNAGAFREDLYFRLAVVPVMVPPLREHPEDIEMLVEHFLPTRRERLVIRDAWRAKLAILARQRARATQLRGASAGPRSDAKLSRSFLRPRGAKIRPKRLPFLGRFSIFRFARHASAGSSSSKESTSVASWSVTAGTWSRWPRPRVWTRATSTA